MAIGTGLALLGSAIIGAGSSLYSGNKTADAAKSASRQQSRGIERGLTQSQPYYESAQNYLAPYVGSGQDTGNLLNDIIGLNGPEAQQAALGMYQSSPSANILQDVIANATRQTGGEFASSGLYRSGAHQEELARRLADISLGDYRNWQNLGAGLYNTGANAASRAAGLATGRGADILGARTGQGTAQASGTIGAANANIAGITGATNYLQNFLGKAGQNDFYGMFGNNATTSGWSPVVSMGA